MSNIIDGKLIAQKIKTKIASDAAKLKKSGVIPTLAVILVGENSASKMYVRNKHKACTETGIEARDYTLPQNASEQELLKLVKSLNENPKIHGILIQLPLPSHINEQRLISAIDPGKDVDGFHPMNLGRLMRGEVGLRPCTPLGIVKLIESTGINIEGKDAVIVGRSNIVGKPVAIMLMQKNATVTICHSKTKDISSQIARADILVAAIGKEKFIKGDWVKPGAVVIDVGINRLPDGKIVGDVDFEGASGQARAITPVPGGVGPMTIAMLLSNTVESAKRKD